MNSIDLKLIISSDYKLSKTFRGVFAYNKLPSIVSSFPSSYIVNTDIAKKKGGALDSSLFHKPRTMRNIRFLRDATIRANIHIRV